MLKIKNTYWTKDGTRKFLVTSLRSKMPFTFFATCIVAQRQAEEGSTYWFNANGLIGRNNYAQQNDFDLFVPKRKRKLILPNWF